MNIQELIKQLNGMKLLYGNKIILTITDGETEYRIKDITGKSCAQYFEPSDHVSEIIVRIDKKLYSDESSSDFQNKWIPVSEKLPESDGCYIVIEKSGRVCTYVFHKEGNSEEYWKRCAVAWSPESYKAESEEQEWSQ